VSAGSSVSLDTVDGSESVDLSPILSNALDAFFEVGFHGTTVRDIARRVNMTVPALYYHHENKEAILYALLDLSIKRVTRLCEQAQQRSNRPDEQYFHLVAALVDYMAEHPKLAAMDNEIRSLSPANYETYRHQRKVVEQMMYDTIRAAAKDGLLDVTAADEATRATLAIVLRIPSWYDPRGGIKRPDLVHRILDLSAHLVGAPTRTVKRVRDGEFG
jgi:AcrR family transcriptional regulator